MEKISGIVPSSYRTKNAEESSAQPARPGAPAMGRPMGRVTLPASELVASATDRLSLSSTEAGSVVQAPNGYKNLQEAKRAKVVDELARKFFETSPKEEIRGTGITHSEEVAENVTEAAEPLKSY